MSLQFFTWSFFSNSNQQPWIVYPTNLTASTPSNIHKTTYHCLTCKVNRIRPRAGVKVLCRVPKERVEVLVLTLVLLLLLLILRLGLEALTLEVLVRLRSIRLVGELRLLVIHLALRTELLILRLEIVLCRELLRTLIEEAGLLRVERSWSELALLVLRCWGCCWRGCCLLVLPCWCRSSWLVVLPDWSWSWLGTAVILRVFVNAGVFAVLAVVFLAVGERVGGVLVV